MYQFSKDPVSGKVIGVIKPGTDNETIPLDNGNKDYRQFLADWQAGVSVLNADGTVAPYSQNAVQTLGAIAQVSGPAINL